jgi:Ser/Thr protein kinase RdoA (MazF antagonist)
MLISCIHDDAVRAACEAWLPGQVVDVLEVDGKGFSGARTLRARGGSFDLVLKSFPAAAYGRVRRSHDLMMHLRRSGCREVPAVVATRGGESIVVTADGTAWEAVEFVNGVMTDSPSAEQAAAAMAMLARIHVAAGSASCMASCVGPAPAVLRRIEHAKRLLASPWESLTVSNAGCPMLADELPPRLVRAAAVHRAGGGDRALRRVAAAPATPVHLQAVLRDIWCGHVLYAPSEPHRIAGVIDFHAADIDTPATDLARLLGSWTQTPASSPLEHWPLAVATYEAVRPLTVAERGLVPWLQATGTIFALDNWFRWCLAEGRRFGEAGRVIERVDRLLDRLEPSFRILVEGVAAV